MMIIWRALITYLDTNLRQGKGVFVKNLGTFTFDIKTDLPNVASPRGRSISPGRSINAERAARKKIHHLRPCFIVDPKIQQHLIRYKGKEEVTNSGNSVFSKGYRMIYANPVPIAFACQMRKDVVRDTLETIFRAIVDLIAIEDKNINLAFGFCNVYITNKNMQVPFADYLTRECNEPDFENKMRRMNSPVSALWRTKTSDMFNKSSLGTMIKKPNQSVADAQALKTEALKLMSMDMSSSGGFAAFRRKGKSVLN